MNQGSDRRAFAVYIAAIVLVGLLIVLGTTLSAVPSRIGLP
ncbi:MULTISPECIES: hypothetical protein [Rhizobium]|nr:MULTISPECIES: hypothetical protein [Rhizobium]